MLLVGFAVDVAQYKALDVRQQFYVGAGYVVIAAAALSLGACPREPKSRLLRVLAAAAPFAFQFSVGALLSASLVFYWFGGAFSASWPVILLVAGLMALSEYMRELFLRPAVKMGVFAFALFSLASIWSAYAFRSVDPQTFLLAGLTSTAFCLTLAAVVARISGSFRPLPAMAVATGGVFLLMVGAYFANVIPPIPLSIREAGVYYDVTRSNGGYAFVGEEADWLARLWPGQTMLVEEGGTLFAYTSVFAPADLSATVVHKWQRYDAATRAWVTESVLSYVMSGGREGGYRGYTKTSRLSAGTWRVSVETERGQVLGRIAFTIAYPND